MYYSDINKVKSKARAILNLKKDGEKLTGNDSEFIKELLEFHDKGEAKLRDFDSFEVGEHPDYAKTRCFFVNRKDGTKEDFSISKCITKLEHSSWNYDYISVYDLIKLIIIIYITWLIKLTKIYASQKAP